MLISSTSFSIELVEISYFIFLTIVCAHGVERSDDHPIEITQTRLKEIRVNFGDSFWYYVKTGKSNAQNISNTCSEQLELIALNLKTDEWGKKSMSIFRDSITESFEIQNSFSQSIFSS